MEDGDLENADCVRDKALSLHALIETASRWSPTITDGVSLLGELVLTSVNQPKLTASLTVNGIPVSYAGVYVDDAQDLDAVYSWESTVNNFISQNDDIVQVSVFNATAAGFSAIIKTSMPSISVQGNDSNNLFTINLPASTLTEGEFSDVQPVCLTDDQIRSVIKKIDELCDCGC